MSADGDTSALVTVPAQILHAEGGRLIVVGEADPTDVELEEASDNDPNIAFLELPVSRIADAKSFKLQLTFFQNGTRVFSFSAPGPLAELPVYRREVTEGATATQRLTRARTNATQLISGLCEQPSDVQEGALLSLELILSDVSAQQLRDILGPYENCIASMAAWEPTKAPGMTRAKDLLARLGSK